MSTETNTLHDWQDIVTAAPADVAAPVADITQSHSAQCTGRNRVVSAP